jgi:hypothetical protein
LTKLFKFLSFLIIAFALGYSQGWWRTYQNQTAPQPLIILTLKQYKDHPLLQSIFWSKIEKAIPFQIVIEQVADIETIKNKLTSNPIKVHLLFLERQDLFQLQNFFDSFGDISPPLLDELAEDFTLEPKGKFFPIFWNKNSCPKKLEVKIWGFAIPQISKRAHKKSLLFISDLIHNPVSYKILHLTNMQLPFKKDPIENKSFSETLRNSLLLD